jgi:hypothetical protein
VIRHWLAVVPSNSLACLHGLTEDVRQRRLLGDVDIQIHVVDETVTQIPLLRNLAQTTDPVLATHRECNSEVFTDADGQPLEEPPVI